MPAKKRTTALLFFIVAALAVAATAAYLRNDEPARSRPQPEVQAPAPATGQPAKSGRPPTYPQASGRDLPADCEQYLEKLAICSQRLDAASDTTMKLQQTIDDARTEWRKVNDRIGLSATCKLAMENFPDATRELGCAQ
jgi:hypothetical protein